ncbi:prepilin-type N-terminal cleavage/methylation domain-containing protein [Corticicoccus populi]|uniref:Prepilin-type N-terminal cleavage/methylation domain-containing protein n=1 Tax=Corticicoccus populi TaxID=1812821 RepID=A0ABW5WW07_9STAP
MLKNSNGFTAVEMMLTLMIVSIILLVCVIHLPNRNTADPEDEILNIGYIFQSAQTTAIKEGKPYIVEMDYINNLINVKNNSGNKVNTYSLISCELNRGGLDRFIYRKNGDTSAFGTIRMTCEGKKVSFIFQINNGRFRIEK